MAETQHGGGELEMKFKKVCTRDGGLIRLFRVMWIRGTVGDGKGYSCSFSVGLFPKVFRWEHGSTVLADEWRLWFCGLRLHFQRSFGGIHV